MIITGARKVYVVTLVSTENETPVQVVFVGTEFDDAVEALEKNMQELGLAADEDPNEVLWEHGERLNTRDGLNVYDIHHVEVK